MLGSHRLPVLLLTCLFVASACGSTEKPAAVPTPAATSAAPAPSATPTASSTAPTAVPVASASATAPCAPVATIPDGTWAGPITMDVAARGGKPFASSKGKGRMRMVVEGGKVTSGTWNVRWTSTGHADTGQAAADIALTGTIKGTVGGSATKPRVDGTWRIFGTVTITKPVHSSGPLDETGTDTETMKPTKPAACGSVSGSFVPSFNSKDAAAQFVGTADWVGTPAP